MSSLSKFALAPLSVAYGAAVRARLALYRRGALRVEHVDAPVLSIGNLTAGGTGKTPLVEWLAREIAMREGRRVCVLTRGYAREDARHRVVVSDGARVLAGEREAGDEPLLLAAHLVARGVAVVCDADRAAAARFALRDLGSEVFILDDGFQHLRVARDLNVATVDATDPWGGGRLLPAGLLREPISGLARADCVVITRTELAENLDGLRAEISRHARGRPIFAARTRTVGVKLLAQILPGESMQDAASGVAREARPSGAFAAFCGIGNPRAFFANLRRDGYELRSTRAFADHHNYTQRDVDEVAREARRAGADALVTTAKDAVKLRGLRFEMPCCEIEIELEIDDASGLMELARAAIIAGDERRSRD
jgi:tetraacyldisaccharide 4'-kinase